MGLDEEGRIHVTYYARNQLRVGSGLAGLKPGDLTFLAGEANPARPTALMATADFVWSFNQLERTFTCVKSRYGEMGQVLQCAPLAARVVD